MMVPTRSYAKNMFPWHDMNMALCLISHDGFNAKTLIGCSNAFSRLKFDYPQTIVNVNGFLERVNNSENLALTH